MIFPTLQVRSLAGQDFTLPQELPARRTAVIVAFHREQQPDVDAWIDPLTQAGISASPRGLPEDADNAVIEIPMIKRRWAPARNLIDGNMATVIANPDINARTLTSYTDVDAFLRPLGLVGDSTVVALVVARDGSISEIQRGRPDAHSLARITAAMGIT